MIADTKTVSGRRPLAPNHLADLRASGLNDRTIAESGIYTESDSAAIARILNWNGPARSLGPCMVIPFIDFATGGFNSFARVKPDHPRPGVKYEQPKGAAIRAYVQRRDLPALRTPLTPLGCTEGEKKSLALSQCGFPTIGLTGIWGWQKTRPRDALGKATGERQLIDEIAAIDWADRRLFIFFDTDQRRNPNVNQAAAELARVIHEHGGRPVIVELPTGPRDPSGLPRKMAVDDFGEHELRRLISELSSPSNQSRSLGDYRADLYKARVESLGKPALYFDRSQTGSGKSYADIAAIRKVGSSLTILPTHTNCRETERDYQSHGLDAVAFPQLSAKTCKNLEAAQLAIDSGLSASQAVCPTCRDRVDCEYRSILELAEESSHPIATHQRAAQSFEQLANGREYVAVHEDPSAVLRPAVETASGFTEVARVADEAINIVQSRSFGAPYQSDQEHFLFRMISIAENLTEELATSTSTAALAVPTTMQVPFGIEARLYEAMQTLRVWTNADPMRLVKLLAAGQIAELVVRVDHLYQKGGAQLIHRSIVGIKQTILPENAAVWISDATGNAADIEMMAGRPVIDATPHGELEQKHPLLQLPLDITRGTAAARVANCVEGIIARLPYQRFGVICHRPHVATIEADSRRITRIGYFGDGSSRGSNDWLEDCDCLLVVGTPRVPPRVVKSRLMAFGLVAAAARLESWTEWGRDYWSGLTVSGARMTVRTRGYRDHDWHRAYQSIVRAELLQAAGRGRTVCQNGIPTLVVTTEDLGLKLLNLWQLPVDETDRLTALAVSQLSLIALKEDI